MENQKSSEEALEAPTRPPGPPSPLLLCCDMDGIHDVAQGFRDLLGSHGVLLKLGLHGRLRDTFLQAAAP